MSPPSTRPFGHLMNEVDSVERQTSIDSYNEGTMFSTDDDESEEPTIVVTGLKKVSIGTGAHYEESGRDRKKQKTSFTLEVPSRTQSQGYQIKQGGASRVGAASARERDRSLSEPEIKSSGPSGSNSTDSFASPPLDRTTLSSTSGSNATPHRNDDGENLKKHFPGSPQSSVGSSGSKKIGGVTFDMLLLPDLDPPAPISSKSHAPLPRSNSDSPAPVSAKSNAPLAKASTDSPAPVSSKSNGPLPKSIPSGPNTPLPQSILSEADAPLPKSPPIVFDSAIHEYQLQSAKCMSLRYLNRNKCHQCISKKSGFSCSFQDIRSLTVLRSDPSGEILDNPGVFLPTNTVDEIPIFPEVYNEPFTIQHADRIKTVASHALLPTLQEELTHSSRRDAIRIKQNLKVRSTCDACLHSILSGSFICQHCGKELCLACGEMMQQFEADSTGDTIVLKTAPRTVNKIMRCTLGAKRAFVRGALKSDGKISISVAHHFSSFIPYTRIERVELVRLVEAMKLWSEEHPREKCGIDLDPHMYYPTQASNSADVDNSPSISKPAHSHMTVPLEDIDRPLNLDSVPIVELQSQTDQVSENFSALWRRGEPMVVDVIDRYQLAWNPEWFMERFKGIYCTTVNNETGEEEATTVSDFFAKFGLSRDGNSYKIKDWPSTADFKTEFPDLFEDFMKAIPVGSVTRRDGVLNVASHSPTNSNPPDLGPKGYFSQISNDKPGGNGSTKLHTVNLMLWSSMNEDGTQGTAAWDMFRREDTEKIREFLREHIAEKEGKKVQEIERNQDDPIHGQLIYLDEDLRAQLFESKGVKPWRIWQKPGQVVFIPAGCPHQVCNFADAIKIASDFVSIENVDLCWKVTDEFRMQTKEKNLWRSDVLQLKSQLLWAWKSCERLDEI